MNSNSSRRGSLPCLSVTELDAALDYYKDVLGFRPSSALDPAAETVIVRRDNSEILLRKAADVEKNIGQTREPNAWQAIVHVDDIEATFDDLSFSGAFLAVNKLEQHSELGTNFSVEDRFGNVLCFAQKRAGWRVAARRWASSRMQRMRVSRVARNANAELRPHLAEFREFYDKLDNKQNIFYMFFSRGLLHWAVKALRYVPAEVNLVLIGSDLSVEERRWIGEHIDRPFHHIDLPVNDMAVWDFLFDTNQHNFGWLDIDCLVLNEKLFEEMTQIPEDTSVNCLWSYDSGFGFRVANTYCLFINIDAIRALQARGIPVVGRPHNWAGKDRMSPNGQHCYHRVPSAKEQRLMLQVLPPDGWGRPRPPGSYVFFDTLSVYQILARAAGFYLNQVRDLDNPTLGPRTDTGDLDLRPQGMSEELIHVGGISYYFKKIHDPESRARYLAADYVTLSALASDLPADYTAQERTVADQLRGLGVEPAVATDLVRGYLTEVGGLPDVAVDKALLTILPEA